MLRQCISSLIFFALALVALPVRPAGPLAAAEEPSLTEELPRIPPVEPDDALATFTVQHGFALQLVAHEPLVSDPVDACFDEHGRMYVAEMHGYPYSEEARPQQPEPIGKRDAGVIRLLEDTDGDGLFDRSTAFADGFSWPTSVCCFDGGVFVIAPPNLWYFKDTDGDRVADVREIRLTGFSRANVQGLANNLKWGLDNRIYAAGGTNSDSVLHREEEEIGPLRGKDFRFDPQSMEVQFLTGGRQFGHSMDDWGNRFVCSNSNHIQHIVYPLRYLNRTAGVSVSGTIRSIAAEGAAAPVFRTSPAEPWRIVRTRRRAADPAYRDRLPDTELVPIGFFTSATGVTIYRGDAYPPEFRGNAFIGDVGGNLVHRKTLTPDGVSFIAERADEGVEFITSTDNWFRPVNFVNGPDGCLYILDMYRETIEHPASIPEDIKTHLDLESGDDRGRIWRLVPPEWTPRPFPDLDGVSGSQLVFQLQSGNAWDRQTAQRLMWERQDMSAVPRLRRLLERSDSATAWLHALYALDGLGALDDEPLVRALGDADPHVREHAVRLAESAARPDAALVRALLSLVDDPDPRVRFQLAFTLGELDGQDAADALARLAAAESNPPEVRTACLTSVRDRIAPMAAAAMTAALASDAPQGLSGWVSELCRLAGSRSDLTAIQVLEALADLPTRAPEEERIKQRMAETVILGLGSGLKRRGTTVIRLLSDETHHADSREIVIDLVRRQAALAEVDAASIADRSRAVRILAQGPDDLFLATVERLLSPQAPPELQRAAAAALAAHPADDIPELILERWSTASPAVRAQLLDALLRDADRTAALLDALSAGDIRPSEIAPEQRQTLLAHPSEAIRTRAAELMGAISPDRQQVIDQYESALDGDADAARGREVFRKSCANCHRVGDEGHAVAPELTSVANKSARDLLISILDPNREAQPNYTNYTAALKDGRVVTGIIVAETADSITFRRAEAKEDVVLREQIDLLQSTGVSLMPVGLEKDLSPQQMADVIAFIRTIPPATD